MKSILTVKSSILERICNAKRQRDFWKYYADNGRAADYERDEMNARAEVDTARLERELETAQARCHVRTIDETDIIDALCGLHKAGFHGSAFKGVMVKVNLNAQTFPGAYHGIPESTFFMASYDGRAWKIESVWRRQCSAKRFDFSLTDAARNAIISAVLDAI